MIPGFVYPLLFLAGALPLWPYARRLSSRPLRAAAYAQPLLLLALPVLPWNWLMLAPALAGINILFAVAFLLIHPPQRPPPLLSADATGRRIRQGLALAAAGLPFALILVGLERWLADVLWSGFFPVNASVDSIPGEVGSAWMLFSLVFLFTALAVVPRFAARGGPRPWQALKLLGWTFLAYLLLHQLYLASVSIPAWQTQAREIVPAWVAGLRETLFQLLAFVGIPAALVLFFRARPGREAAGEFAAAMGALMLALLSLAWITAMPIHYALLLGQEAEKSGRPHRAIPWYSRALTWSQSPKLKSYLQFRVGLLYRKTGKLEAARDAFVRVLVRYPDDESLLADADAFKERLAAGSAAAGKRVVIPGIEARTEYKSAYCVPNSLGLLLNFWGDRTGAKRIGSQITQLDRGSLITDQVHFAESRGFASLVLPLCTLDGMFRLLDAGIPVLAFIPGHVIAVFGYDEALETLVTYDVNTFDIWDDNRWGRFMADWRKTYNTLGIVVPREMLPRVRTVLGQDAESRSEAYLRYLLASLTFHDPDLRLSRLRAALVGGFFPAGWEYRALSGRKEGAAADDSAAEDFLLRRETEEEEASLEFGQDLLWRGKGSEAADFLRALRDHGGPSASLTQVLAAAELSAGNAPAAEALLSEVGHEDLDDAAAAFLLARAEARGSTESGRLGRNLLARDALSGALARHAYRAWRGSAPWQNDVDGALAEIRAYLDRWNPFDTLALRDLPRVLEARSFRPHEERAERTWKKAERLLALRRKRLEWAAEPDPEADRPKTGVYFRP